MPKLAELLNDPQVRSAMLGAGIGVGVGGLTGAALARKRRARGALYGALLGGLAGGSTGYVLGRRPAPIGPQPKQPVAPQSKQPVAPQPKQPVAPPKRKEPVPPLRAVPSRPETPAVPPAIPPSAPTIPMPVPAVPIPVPRSPGRRTEIKPRPIVPPPPSPPALPSLPVVEVKPPTAIPPPEVVIPRPALPRIPGPVVTAPPAPPAEEEEQSMAMEFKPPVVVRMERLPKGETAQSLAQFLAGAGQPMSWDERREKVLGPPMLVSRRELAALAAGTSPEGADRILARALAERARVAESGTDEEKALLRVIERISPVGEMAGTWRKGYPLQAALLPETIGGQTYTSSLPMRFPAGPFRRWMEVNDSRLRGDQAKLRTLLGHEAIHLTHPLKDVGRSKAKVPGDLLRAARAFPELLGSGRYWATNSQEMAAEAREWADAARLRHGIGSSRHPTLEEYRDTVKNTDVLGELQEPATPAQEKERDEVIRKMWMMSRWLARAGGPRQAGAVA